MGFFGPYAKLWGQNQGSALGGAALLRSITTDGAEGVRGRIGIFLCGAGKR
jgi:hypothetical protein